MKPSKNKVLAAALVIALIAFSVIFVNRGRQSSKPESGTQTIAVGPDSGAGSGAAISDHSEVAPTGGVPVVVTKTQDGGRSVASTGIGGTSTPSATAPGVSADAAKALTDSEPKAPEVGCFDVTYKHKPMVSHGNEEACSHHKNLIRLKHKDVKASSVCIRVNGTPTRFTPVKGKPGEFMLGAIAGPKAKIVARYCVGKHKCNDDCKIPKDEFLDAIGGNSEDGSGEKLAFGHWDGAKETEKDSAANAKLVADMKKELSGFEDEGGAGDGYTLFQDWITEAEIPATACTIQQAPADKVAQVEKLKN